MPPSPTPKLTPERKAALIAERAKTDPARQYQPAPTFLRYHQSDALYKAISTANQVGKTTAIQMETVWSARGIHPYRPFNFAMRILCVVPSRAQASVVWGKRFLEASELKGDVGKFPMIPAREIKRIHNAYSPMGPYPGCIELKNGSTIYFALSGDKNSWKRLEGMTFDRVFRDEADGSDNLAEEIQPRLLKAQSDVNKPGAGSIDWAATSTKPNDEWQSFREKAENGITTSVGRYELFCPDPNENPAVSPAAREAMAATMSAEAYAVRGQGDADAEDNLTIYRKWSREKHVRKTPYEVGLTDNLWCAYDPGFRHPCGIGFFALNQAEPYKLRMVGYVNYRYGSLRDHVRSIIDYLDGRALEALVCDPSINRNLPQGVKHLTLLENEVREQGLVLHQPIMLGRNRLEDMVPQLERYFEQGLIEVDPWAPGAEQYIKEIEAYRWDDKAIGRVVYRKQKGGDEAPDITKYCVSRFPGYNYRGENPRRTGANSVQPLTATASELADPFAGMSPDERLHAQRLAESVSLYHEAQGHQDDLPIAVSGW